MREPRPTAPPYPLPYPPHPRSLFWQASEVDFDHEVKHLCSVGGATAYTYLYTSTLLRRLEHAAQASGASAVDESGAPATSDEARGGGVRADGAVATADARKYRRVRQDLEASALRTALQSTAESDTGPNQRVMLVHAMSDWQYRSCHRKHPQVVSVAFAASAF